jgi:hypothetical protein
MRGLEHQEAAGRVAEDMTAAKRELLANRELIGTKRERSNFVRSVVPLPGPPRCLPAWSRVHDQTRQP